MYVVSLTGDHYQIGLQHGRKLRKLIHYAVRNRCRFHKYSGQPSPEALQRRACAVESSFPEITEEMRGIADGSQTPLDDILLHNLSPIPDGCTNVAFLECRQPMLGHVNDDQSATFDVAFYIRPSQGPEILQIGEAGSVGAGAAMNSEGLAMSHACSRGIAGLGSNDAFLNLPVLRRLLIERNFSCHEARGFLSAHSFSSGADNIICVDRTGDGFVAEKLPTMVEFRETSGRGIYCTGRALTAKIRAAVGQDAYERGGPPEIPQLIAREKLFEDVLADPEQALSTGLLLQLLQNSDEGVEISNRSSTWAVALVPSDFEMWLVDGTPSRGKFTRLGRTSKCRFI